MLILTRKVDQAIIISGNIWVRVLGVERDRVKIGISAPLEVTVLREELLEREREGRPGKAAEQGRNDDAGDSAPSPVATREEPPANK
jgi:carbon storage regulator